ncbi:DNA polymerase epsilon subunit 1 [Clonorchis sinensis]|uniref:DNA polymerase epsilon subunit 1 n=1 Tax=Clonorchis sinensis TaxID=79923 RepID=G7YWJ6_CLOSI|nr:DNA polymerase epsilon subunit 1 [Clonorchis sinensis]
MSVDVAPSIAWHLSTPDTALTRKRPSASHLSTTNDWGQNVCKLLTKLGGKITSHLIYDQLSVQLPQSFVLRSMFGEFTPKKRGSELEFRPYQGSSALDMSGLGRRTSAIRGQHHQRKLDVLTFENTEFSDLSDVIGTANVESLVDGKDNEWGEYDVSGDAHESQTTTKLPEPELDMHWHIARYLPETRGLRAKFQTLLAGYLLSVYTAVRTEHRRLRSLHNSQMNTSVAGVRQFGTELAQNIEEQGTNNSDADRTSFTVALQSDASISPGVLESTEQLIREQLAPELYTLVQRLHRKAAWIDSTLTRKDSITGNLGAVLKRRAQVVAAYLAEKTIPNVQHFDTTDLDQDVATADVILPLLPPHPGIYTFNFTPLLDFIKAICEVI